MVVQSYRNHNSEWYLWLHQKYAAKKRDQVWYVSEVEKWFWEIYRGSFIEKLVPCIEENIKIVKRLSNRVENTGDQPRLFHQYSVFFVRSSLNERQKRKKKYYSRGYREVGREKKKEKSLYNFSCNCLRHFYPTRQLLFIIIVGTGLFIILLFMTTARYR